MKLFGADICPFVHRVRLVLAEKSLAHDYVAIDLANKPAWYHQVLPTGRVPLLEDGEARIWESDIICEYLDEEYPDKPMRPKSAKERARMKLTISWGQSLVAQFYRLLSSQESTEREKAAQKWGLGLAEMDERLKESGSDFFLDEFSLADISLYPWFERHCVLQHYRNQDIPDELPSLKKWLNALEKRASVQALRIEPGYFVAGYRSYADGSKVPS